MKKRHLYLKKILACSLTLLFVISTLLAFSITASAAYLGKVSTIFSQCTEGGNTVTTQHKMVFDEVKKTVTVIDKPYYWEEELLLFYSLCLNNDLQTQNLALIYSMDFAFRSWWPISTQKYDTIILGSDQYKYQMKDGEIKQVSHFNTLDNTYFDDSDSDDPHKYQWITDNNNRMIQYIDWYDGAEMEEAFYYYDSKGRLVKSLTNTYVAWVQTTETYTYSSDNKLLKIHCVKANVSSYDTKNAVISSDDEMDNYTIEFSYKNNLVKTATYNDKFDRQAKLIFNY